MVAVAGLSAIWSSAPGLTLRLAVAVLPPSVPVTVWGPTTVAVHVAPVHEPSGLIVNVVEVGAEATIKMPSKVPSAMPLTLTGKPT